MTEEVEFPQGVILPLEFNFIESKIPIWDGIATLRQGSESKTGQTEIFLERLPHPQFRFRFSETENDHEIKPVDFLKLFQRDSLANGFLDCSVPLGTLAIRPSNQKNSEISGRITHSRIPRDLEFDEARLLIVNGPDCWGTPITRGTHHFRGRIGWIGVDKIDVTVDQLSTSSSLSGMSYETTAVARFSSINTINPDSYERLSASLFRTLSFMRGRWVGMIGPWLYRNGELLSIVPNTTKMSLDGGGYTWYHEQIYDAFDEVFSLFHLLHTTPDKSEAIQTAFHWYVEAQLCAGGVEGAIVLQQAALEALAWLEVVQLRKICSSSGFEKLYAADKIRWLLSLYGISKEIPSHNLELVSYAKSQDHINDLVDILVDVRNAMVHGTPKKVTRLFQRPDGGTERQGLWWLTNGVLEQCILAVIGYDVHMLFRDKNVEYASSAIQLAPWNATLSKGIKARKR